MKLSYGEQELIEALRKYAPYEYQPASNPANLLQKAGFHFVGEGPEQGQWGDRVYFAFLTLQEEHERNRKGIIDEKPEPLRIAAPTGVHCGECQVEYAPLEPVYRTTHKVGCSVGYRQRMQIDKDNER